jgi:hypothetical protein
LILPVAADLVEALRVTEVLDWTGLDGDLQGLSAAGRLASGDPLLNQEGLRGLQKGKKGRFAGI